MLRLLLFSATAKPFLAVIITIFAGAFIGSETHRAAGVDYVNYHWSISGTTPRHSHFISQHTRHATLIISLLFSARVRCHMILAFPRLISPHRQRLNISQYLGCLALHGFSLRHDAFLISRRDFRALQAHISSCASRDARSAASYRSRRSDAFLMRRHIYRTH